METDAKPAGTGTVGSDVRQVWHHAETIKCPKCGLIQDASVQHTAPFWSYAHECHCGHWITESEWETVPNASTEARYSVASGASLAEQSKGE